MAPAPVRLVDLTGRRVLVVDDTPPTGGSCERSSNAGGCRCVIADRRAAIGLVGAGERFDLVIADLHMPELDGIALATALRAADAESVISPRSASMIEREAVAASLVKPVKPSALYDTIATVLPVRATAVPVRPAGAGIDRGLGARHPLRILLAEDNPVNQKLALRLLERMGYRADVAENGLAAISAVEGSTYDVILMDVQMPELDGLEATCRIRRRWPGGTPRIVAMTANAMDGDREACGGHGRLHLEAHRAGGAPGDADGGAFRRRGTRTRTGMSQARILVVDDTPFNRRLVVRLLEGIGHEAVEAGDGREALERLRDIEAQPIDLVLLDIEMPEMDGHETLAAIKSDEALRELRRLQRR